ncbi:hypothetical protein M422DRAFT_779090 [Sphaerobolus stellatus SS14]|uniref:S-adenosyl-L-methionine-dependent methyltransferase n=1 Tax=Sphaerobolus stellatus (strain SS14) TaxID=990650 RepID=A0A0C9VDP6_SPHS4|nr:hypothetical protein M422DRAFT_779090 [Sphaerobolus stellatus SS14]
MLGEIYTANYALITASVISVAIIIFLKMYAKDPYGTYHLGLNMRPGQDSTKPPKTEWLNMGYWRDTDIFPDACEALALKIIKEAKPIPRGHVLDVGHACGDSLLLYLQHPSLPRPESLCGSSATSQDCKVNLLCADAIFRSQSAEHPLNPSSTDPLLTSITAIDCAYHFASRELFLTQCYTRLAPGGRIALGDLVIAKRISFPLRFLLSKLLSVRSENIITPEEYEAQLRKAGYADIHIENVSENVFPQFQAFLVARGGLWRVMAAVIGWWETAGGRFVIVGASKPDS